MNSGLSGAKLCAAVGSHKWRAHDDETVWCVECGAKEKVVTQRDRQIESLLADNVRLSGEFSMLNANYQLVLRNEKHLHEYIVGKDAECDQLRARIGELEQEAVAADDIWARKMGEQDERIAALEKVLQQVYVCPEFHCDVCMKAITHAALNPHANGTATGEET